MQGVFRWGEERIADDDWLRERPRRDLWSYIQSWLVSADQLGELTERLSKRSFMGRRMPEGGEITNAAYLGEMPWAASATEYPPEWSTLDLSDGSQPAIRVFPAWTGYLWEGVARDCSIEQTVSVSLPATPLFELGQLEWIPARVSHFLGVGADWQRPSRRRVALGQGLCC